MAKRINKIYEVEIKNWEKYNPNKKHFHNRMMISVDFLSDELVLRLTQSEVILYLSCICSASKQNSSRCYLDTKLLSFQSRMIPSRVLSGLQNIESLGLLTIISEKDYSKNTPLSRVKMSKVELSKVEHTSPASDSLPSASGEGSWRSLLEIYNSNRGTLPEAKAWNKDREKKAQARWKELPDEKQWVEVMKYYSNSAFHTGGNDRNWVADFGFILQPKRWLEAAEKSSLSPTNKSWGKENQISDAFDEARKIMEACGEI